MSRRAGFVSGVAVLAVGLLGGIASLIRWWGACYPSSVGTPGCDRRREPELVLHGFTDLPGSLHVAAVLLALSGLASAALWFAPLLFVPRQRWREIALSVAAVIWALDPIAQLVWHVGGHRLLDPVVASWTSIGAWSVLAIITYAPSQQFIAAEGVASRRRGAARLPLIFAALFVAGPVGTFIDALTFHWAYNSPRICPGEGLLQASVLVALASGVLLTCRGSRRSDTGNEPESDPPEYMLAA